MEDINHFVLILVGIWLLIIQRRQALFDLISAHILIRVLKTGDKQGTVGCNYNNLDVVIDDDSAVDSFTIEGTYYPRVEA